ncbi:MAG: quinohemoprotein amine dehydrogenase subunit alpha [Burkholderiaceae bacterium]
MNLMRSAGAVSRRFAGLGRALSTAVLAVLLLQVSPAAIADPSLLEARCGACHTPEGTGLSRIVGQRKTPEGWMMTIVRMQRNHGVQISVDERRSLVQWLSDHQGLAPSETEGQRFALEKAPNVIEAVPAPVGEMCARCHTGARVALQRRSADEWRLHMDFHVGQFPTVEYQALGRDRPWYDIAVNEIAPLLSERYPLETDAWKAWSGRTHKAPDGEWIVIVDLPGKGEAYGRLTVKGEASPFAIAGRLMLADGSVLPVEGSMNLYTGYEWRANLEVGDTVYRQVLAISEDGKRLSGRQFERQRDSIGAPLRGVRVDAAPVMLGLVPSTVPAGEADVQVVGAGMYAVKADAEGATVRANKVGARVRLTRTENGVVRISQGDQHADLTVYANVDRIAVEPEFTIARVGGGTELGPDRVPAWFHAIGYWNGPDGKPGTEDDVRVGRVPAQWSVAPEGEAAAAMDDARFAGKMGDGGLFTPAVAGPNPERQFSTNNAGDLKVTATAGELTAHGRLIVTVQRFNDPPIR